MPCALLPKSQKLTKFLVEKFDAMNKWMNKLGLRIT